jgi:hypothetical protein
VQLIIFPTIIKTFLLRYIIMQSTISPYSLTGTNGGLSYTEKVAGSTVSQQLSAMNSAGQLNGNRLVTHPLTGGRRRRRRRVGSKHKKSSRRTRRRKRTGGKSRRRRHH